MEAINDESLKDVACKTEKAFLNRFNPEYLEWNRLIGMELMEGEPLPKEELAKRLQISTGKMDEIIETYHNIERDEEGRIVALGGYSLEPTRHRCTTDDKEFYVWCAGDSLGFPVLLDMTLDIESICYATGEEIKLTVSPDEVKTITPEESVVSVVVPEDLPEDIRGFYCDRVNFFKSKEVASKWLSNNDDGIILPVEEAFEYYREMINRIKS